MWPLLLLGFLVFAFTSPKQQSESYHAFADQRSCCCVPNAMDVSSNLLFLFVGLWRASHAVTEAEWIFACGVILTAFGSAYYHLLPTTERLVWDRLPMTLAFGSAFHEALGTSPVLASLTGAMTVLWWKRTLDLRAYAVFQYGGLVCVMWSGTHNTALAMYVAAKVCELLDRRIFKWTNYRVSGHTLKHALAAAACAVE